MRLLDLELSIERQLGELRYPAYLCAMCVVGDVVRSIYLEHFPAPARPLAARTLAAAGMAAGGDDLGAREIGAALAGKWKNLMDDPYTDAPGPVLTAMLMFEALAGELAGSGRQRAALTMVSATVAEYDGSFHVESVPRLVDASRTAQIDVRSPGVQLLWQFGRVADLIAENDALGLACVPQQIRAAVFG